MKRTKQKATATLNDHIFQVGRRQRKSSKPTLQQIGTVYNLFPESERFGYYVLILYSVANWTLTDLVPTRYWEKITGLRTFHFLSRFSEKFQGETTNFLLYALFTVT